MFSIVNINKSYLDGVNGNRHTYREAMLIEKQGVVQIAALKFLWKPSLPHNTIYIFVLSKILKIITIAHTTLFF